MTININCIKTARVTVFLSVLACISSLSTLAQQVKLPQEKDMAAYLMVYFKDETHGLYMALSKDGYSFTDVNKGLPIVAGDTIAEQKGIRDPYIYRGADGYFYLALTDLHIFAQKAGIRSTEWERDGKQYGWGNNRGLVIMKSADLIHWSHKILRIDQSFPGLEEIGCAWAPEIIYDPVKKKPMIYFSMRLGTGKEKVYYSYMDEGLNKLETRPEVLFEYPKDVAYIDADITFADGKYHLFYVPHDDNTAGVKHAVSATLTGGYVYESPWVDPEPTACEAPTVYKRIGENKWVLIYDVYRPLPSSFGFSETTDFKTFTNLGHFNQGTMKATNFSSPKHGAVIHLTKKEATALAKAWKLDMTF